MNKSEITGSFDVAVVGGGPSGRIAALALAKLGLSTVLVAPTSPQSDGRTTALWQQSIELLRDLGIWDRIEASATSLRKMRMIDDTGRLIRAPEVVFDSAELGLEEFGFNILNSELNVALQELCDELPGLTVVEDTVASAELLEQETELRTQGDQKLSVRLVVAADGRNSLLRETAGIPVRRWSYPQNAVVLNLEHSLPHQHVSTEFHTPTGPFTLVPLPGRQSSLVCVETAEGADALIALSDDELERELERRAHSILGRFKLATRPQCFPLSGLAAERLIGHRLALIGETAHVFPPIGAQGLNLSLRDIIDLTTTLGGPVRKGLDFGEDAVLKAYENKRLRDIRSRTNAVDVLNRSLLTGFLPVQIARSLSMYLAGKLGPVRRFLMHEGMTPGSGFRPKNRP
ncbi:MAG: UbiH/UbiF family hydroxylase [Roseibium sp.]|nr:UbiH/UbiF family hydroxylase [Roseibium sp.]